MKWAERFGVPNAVASSECVRPGQLFAQELTQTALQVLDLDLLHHNGDGSLAMSSLTYAIGIPECCEAERHGFIEALRSNLDRMPDALYAARPDFAAPERQV
jgi:hypothetical protein